METVEIPAIVIDSFNLNSLSVDELGNQHGNASRTVWWIFQRADQKQVLVSKTGTELERIIRLHRIQNELKSLGAFVDSPLPSNEGTTAIYQNGRIWSLSDHIGDPKTQLSLMQLESTGSAIARFHQTAAKIRRKIKPCRGSLMELPIIVQSFLNTTASNQSLWTRQIIQCGVINNLLVQTDFRRRYELIGKTMTHGDFCERNVLWTGDTITGLVDFELFGCEIPSFDLCFFASEYAMSHRNSDWQNVLEALLSGYSRILNLNGNEKELLQLTFLIVTMYRFRDDCTNTRPVELVETTIAAMR